MARLKATLDLIGGAEAKEYYQERYRAYRTYRRADCQLRRAIADPSNREHDELRAKCQDFLNHYELVALACREGLVDEAFYRGWTSAALLRDWREATILIIEARRASGPGDVGSPGAYTEFERLACRWGGQPIPREAFMVTGTAPPPAR